MKEEHDVALERHEKEMAEMRRKEAFAKTSVINEFKSSDMYKEAVEGSSCTSFFVVKATLIKWYFFISVLFYGNVFIILE